MVAFDEVLAKVQPQEVTVVLPVCGDLVGRLRVLNERLRQAEAYDSAHNEPDTAPGIRAELESLQADWEADKVTFTFRGIPRHEWLELQAQCPPPDTDRLAGYDYDREKFPPLAMAASMTSPEGATIEGVRDLAEKMSNGPFTRLWEACCQANVGVADEMIPFTAAAIDAALASVSNSTTAAAQASPTASSSDG